MKKIMFAMCVILAVFFSAAVGLCVQVLAAPRAVNGMDASLRIVLDAGHGGVDGGVVGKTTGKKESELNLSITYKLKTMLEDMGFEIVLTRKTDAGLYDAATKGFKKRDMLKRKEIIQDADPALVISIHQNFYPSKNTRGGQVFYRKESEGGVKLATDLQKGLNGLYADVGARARVAASGEFFMLQCADCPSVIVECGFLSNAADELLLTNESWQKRLAETLAGGVLTYFSHVTA